eukprot:scaffold44814_cov58-Phaeocystis_antarctica.AAC.6
MGSVAAATEVAPRAATRAWAATVTVVRATVAAGSARTGSARAAAATAATGAAVTTATVAAVAKVADNREFGCSTASALKDLSCSTKALALRPGCDKSCGHPIRCSVWRSACFRARAALGSSTPGTRGR